MSPKRARLLAELLDEVRTEGGFIPDQAYRPFHKLCSWSAVETLIVSRDMQSVLLRYRSDDFGDGWHVVGGYIKPKETIHQFCNRAALEDAGMEDGVRILGQIAVSKWLDHHFGFPLCVLVICNSIGAIVEREDLKFFSVDKLPMGKMWHPKHVLYLKTYLDYLKHPERICPILGE